MLPILQKALLWIISVTSIVVPSSLLTLYVADQTDLFKPKTNVVSVLEVPFDGIEASKVCEIEAEDKFSGQLRHTSVDWHSTRFQEDRNVFLVVLKGTVGPASAPDRATMYCYVNPTTELVTYFKAYNAENESLLGRSINIDAVFGNMKSQIEQ